MEDIIYGRNSVMELLTSTSRTINKLLIIKGDSQGSIKKIISVAREKHIVISEVTKQKMDEMAEGGNHQGVIALTTPYEYCEIDDIINAANERSEKPLVLILDGIEDPHNLGSIIRTAETAGAHGIIIPKRRTATVNSTVNKSSAGAVEHMNIARVNNISDAMEELKKAGLWICGTDMDAKNYYYEQDLKGPIGIVIGSEGNGMGEKVKNNCDFLVKIPMHGKISSLNASVSAGIVIYEVVIKIS